jgi:hypothetical protein
MKKPSKHPEDMSAAELAAATKELDRPYVFERAKPMNATQRAVERRLRGRPKIGAGAKKVSISLEGRLLKMTDAVAKKEGINRSQLIANLIVSGLGRRAG